MRDEKAIKMLTKGCWGSSGWKSKLDLTKSEIEYLRNAGLARDKIEMDHDELVAWGIESCKRVTRERVVHGFVSSLGTRHLEYRSALGSYAHLHLLKQHKLASTRKLPPKSCEICGSGLTTKISERDFIILNFERFKWGGVRHPEVDFAAYDIELFSKLEPVEPTAADWSTLKSILKLIQDPVKGKSVNVLKKEIATLIPGNAVEAENVCQILAYIGVMATDKNPGFYPQYINDSDRVDGGRDTDRDYPLSCWKWPGYQSSAAKFWFPELGD